MLSALSCGDQVAISFQQTDAVVQVHGQDVIRAVTDEWKSSRRSGFEYRECVSSLLQKNVRCRIVAAGQFLQDGIGQM